MLARIQQALMLALLLAAALWAAAFWPERPAWAVAGALAILFGFAAVLALEFALQAAVSTKDPVPGARAASLLQAWWQEARVFVQVFFWRQPFRADAVPDVLPVSGASEGQLRGVVFIHGLGCNRGFWTPWLRQLQAVQRPFIAVNLEPPGGDIDRHVPTVEDAVRRITAATGLAPMLVCHSMGGLVARAWLRDQAAASPPAERLQRVHRVVTIATPHQGTWLARLSRAAHAVQMRLGSDWLGRFGEKAAAPLFVCWYSDADNMVFPPSSGSLPGADNRLIPGVAHVALAFEPRVLRETLALL